MPLALSRRAAAALLLLCLPTLALAQDRTGAVQVRVKTDRADWLYSPGQPVKFSITVIRDGHPVPNAKLTYKIGPEQMTPTIDRSVSFTGAELSIDAGSLNAAGFLRCIATAEVDGKTYRGLATAAFAPEKIEPTVADPSDFDSFWTTAKAQLAQIPLDAKLTPMPESSTAHVACSQVNLRNFAGGVATSRLYGVLCQPRAPGKYPALLYVPGAGVRPYRGALELAEKGIITFQIGIHGIPINLDQNVYDSLAGGALQGYNIIGLDHRDRYYYKRVYLGCVRANDFLTSLPNWNGEDLAVTGGSQGGALSIVTAALDPRVKSLAALYPALADTTGYLKNRAGGWPHMFRTDAHRSPDKIATIGYYDVVNFARRLKVPGFYTWGFNDETCPPTSMYAAYNVITAPKRLLLAIETGHNNVPEQMDRLNQWLEAQLKRSR